MKMRSFGWMAVGLLAACGPGNTGAVQVFVEAEDSIPEGLEPGTGEENIQDGWTVRYQKFLVTVGNFRASQSAAPEKTLNEPAVYVVDLLNLPTSGVTLASFEGVEAVRWDKVGYDMPKATAAALSTEGLEYADHDRMIQNGYSVYVEGTISKSDGQSCLPTAPTDCVAAPQVTFKWGLPQGTRFDDCANEEGQAGFAVPSGGTVQVKPTLHGDHWFFTNITQGAELTDRKAQWVADADLDRNGETTEAELKQVQATSLFTQANGYNTSGAILPVNTAYDFFAAQAHTLGDYQGEGECPTRAILE